MKNVYHQVDKDVAANLTNLSTDNTGMQDNPLEFLATPALHEEYWSLSKIWGKDKPKHKQSLEFSKKLLNLPLTPHGFQALLAKTEGNQAKRELQRWYKQGMEAAALEADLMMVDSVKSIAWIPDQNLPEKGDMKGYYKLLVKRKNGDIQTVIPTSDWVHVNFMPEVIAIAQRVAYQSKESLVCIESDDSNTQHSGYIMWRQLGLPVPRMTNE